MSHAEEEYNRAKSKMLDDFKQAITDAAALREAETGDCDDDPAAAPAIVEKKSGSAMASPAGAFQAAAVTADEVSWRR